MPATSPGAAGVKLVTVAPANPGRGHPRIQGVYVLFDPETLAPAALVDGIALTDLRTAAVSALAVRHLAAEGAERLVVFGTGAQGWAHVGALRAVAPGIAHVGVVARDRGRLDAFVARCTDEHGVEARAVTPDAVRDADLVVCATTAREPLFDGALVRDDATVVAIGSHEPAAREVDVALAGRTTVVVESRSSALREAGDVIAAIGEGALREDDLVTLAALMRGEASPAAGRPRLFKSTGMAWEDLVVAAAVHARAGG
jgi:ornithine cyclodeaminase/alanine dehydrogenase-like protein (mu-crystallin family)